jgi:tripartite-type tricarboxylate transporter receptor subunit TctC
LRIREADGQYPAAASIRNGETMGRLFTAAVAGALMAGMPVTAEPVLAQTYPSRHVRTITGGAGSFHDVVARQLGQRLSERWGRAVVIENQPAAGLTIGSSIAAKAEPDGYTLLLADRTALAAAPHLYRNLRYDPAKDFRPITLVARAPSVLVAYSGLGVADLREFIDYARRQPKPVMFAAAGVGTVAHLTGELFRQLTKLDIQFVQYKGGVDATLAVLKGEAQFTSGVTSVVLPHIAAGKMKGLAVGSAWRFSAAPDIPTGAEAGLPGFEAEQWLGIVAPAGLPDEIAGKLNRDIVDVVRTAAFQEMLRAQGGEVSPGTPAELTAFIASESTRLKSLIEATGLLMQ